ncbi:outer membrane beta-barrel protein [Rhizobium sp. RU36D]|uniref:outer membrane beta-barrel protein n=1 Tax=Rhizobium sp. RU36D TaxID=1907415 RepID=UPI0009D80CE6|nr:outer membrane beta-barrel protein [Rhizobium sp. RU36D]SMD16721.1 lipid A oxidase [Rhizobium sp. RU36D]
MNSKLISQLSACLLSGAAFMAASSANAEDFNISVYGGYQTAPHSTVDVTGPTAPTSFTAGWDGKSFSAPPYYGVRGVWWLENFGKPNLGVSIDFSHAKVYADTDTLRKTGWSHFEFSDGLNLLTLNGLYRFPIENTRFTPYVGAGVGLNIPHVEVTRGAFKTFEYQVGGATLQAQAGVDVKITDRWSMFAEYKGNYSWVDVDIDRGDKLKTNVLTNAINVGVTLKF